MTVVLRLSACLLALAAVTTAHAQDKDKADEVKLEGVGFVTPVQLVQVNPLVGGRLVLLNVSEGSKVKKGDVLAVIEDTDYRADADRARAVLAKAEAKVAELKNSPRPEDIVRARAAYADVEAEYKLTEDMHKRMALLFKEGAVSTARLAESEKLVRVLRGRLDKGKLDLEAALAGPAKEVVDAAIAEAAVCRADLLKAQWRLDNCRVLAPADGTILVVNAAVGDLMNPASTIRPNLCNLADLTRLEIAVDVAEADIAQVAVGQKCRVRLRAFPDRVYEGEVSRVLPLADRSKGAVPVRVRVRVPQGEDGQFLRPEMSAVVYYLAAPKKEDK